MSLHISGDAVPAETTPVATTCPPWCVAPHGMHGGEEDWVHLGEPTTLTDRLPVQLCMSVDPQSRHQDGPYVLVGPAELTPAEADAIGRAILALAEAAASTTFRAAP